MQHTLTQNDLVRYLYGECSPAEMVAIRREIRQNPEWQARYEAMKASMDAFESLRYAPRASTVSDLLRYSRSTAPVETTR
jgi:anti-sigma factor RsiW